MAVYGPVGAEELYHYGIPRKSGRYPYGSGKEPYQDDPKKRRLNKDESAPKARSAAKVASAQKNFAKNPETIWSKHRKAQAEKQAEKDRQAKEEAAKKAEAAKPASQKAKEMTDEELMRAINRLRLEQTYISMINPPKQSGQQNQNQQQQVQKTIDKGKKFIDKLKSGSKDVADLSQNIGNIMGGAQKAYANYQSIMKLMEAAKKRNS